MPLSPIFSIKVAVHFDFHRKFVSSQKSLLQLLQSLSWSKKLTVDSLKSFFSNLQGTWKPISNDLQEECGIGYNTAHIVGGSKTKKGDYPFMALLGYENNNSDCPDRVITINFILHYNC